MKGSGYCVQYLKSFQREPRWEQCAIFSFRYPSEVDELMACNALSIRLHRAGRGKAALFVLIGQIEGVRKFFTTHEINQLPIFWVAAV